MQITIHNTTKITELNGIPCRIWEGETSSGIKVHAYITRVSVDVNEPEAVHDFFKTELMEMSAPSPEVQAIPLRMIL